MTTVVDDDQAARHREAMVDRMIRDGALTSPRLIEAARRVPRHLFLSGFFRDAPNETGGGAVWYPVPHPSADELIEAAYTDESWVTQLDGAITPDSAGGPLTGKVPSSSSTLPSLVFKMLADADVVAGNRVLEIGTGTGYSTAALCELVGAAAVTSVEVDAEIMLRAFRALAAAGYHPHLRVGDGLLGCPDHAPYDRIIATCALHRIPRAWLRQVRPGGLILATLGGHFMTSQLARVQVTQPGYARGTFLDGDSSTSYMVARTEPEASPLGNVTARTANPDTDELSDLSPDVLDSWMARWVARLAAHDAQLSRVVMMPGEVPATFLFAGESFAAVTPEGQRWRVKQGGPRRLWDEVRAGLLAWQEADRPGPSAFEIDITPTSQQVRLSGAGPVWQL